MTLQQLEQTVSELPPEQFAKFREWFLAFDADNWDRQIEADVSSGRLDRLVAEEIAKHRNGESTRL